MKRLRLSFHSPKENNAMARVRNRWNKWLTRTARLAPTLCVVSAGVVLILFSSAGRSHGQTISDTQVDPAAPPCLMDGLRLQPFRSGDPTAGVGELHAGDDDWRYHLVPVPA